MSLGRYKSACESIQRGEPLIIIWEDKHGPVYHLARTVDELNEIALWHLSVRIKNGYIYAPVNHAKMPSLSEDEAAKLPEGAVRKAAMDEHYSFKKLTLFWNEKTAEWNRINEAMAKQDGEKAWLILDNRTRYEYERMEAVIPDKVK